MAMTVGMIMILFYGAAGVPGGGEIPMKQTSKLLLNGFPSKGMLRTNTANKTFTAKQVV